MAIDKVDEKLVARFLALKREVLNLCDEPSAVEPIAQTDAGFRGMCLELRNIASALEESEENAANGVIAPVNPQYQKEWVDYKKRWAKAIFEVYFRDWAGSEIYELCESLTVQPLTDEEATASLAVLAADEAKSINAAITHLKDLRDCGEFDYSHDLALTIDEALEAWTDLSKKAGLDVCVALRRYRLVPTLLVPQHVARKVGSKETLSLYRLWIDARRAFIFGASLAALAMARAILERLLQDVYHAKGDDLNALINDYERRKGVAASRQSELHAIRWIAIAVLHGEKAPLKFLKDDLERRRREKIIQEALGDDEARMAATLHILKKLIEADP